MHICIFGKNRRMCKWKTSLCIKDGKSDFGGQVRQMMPPYMVDGRNTAEMLIANMDYAGVSGCVVTQEYIDGNQDNYFLECRKSIRSG